MKTNNYSDESNISVSEYYKQLFSDLHSRSSEPELMMQWSLKTVAGSPRDLMLFRFLLIAGISGFAAFIAYIAYGDLPESADFIIGNVVVLALTGGLFITASYAKTVYRYKVFKTHARLAYCQNISRHAGTLFKGFVGIGLCCLLMIAIMSGIMSGSILVLIGPCGMAIIAALRFLDMKIPKKRDWSAPWDEYNLVTVDRKHRFVVTHIDDDTLGFEARLPNDELLEQYLAFLRSVLPPSAQFTEKRWNLSLI
jgi:hypothetical protein